MTFTVIVGIETGHKPLKNKVDSRISMLEITASKLAQSLVDKPRHQVFELFFEGKSESFLDKGERRYRCSELFKELAISLINEYKFFYLAVIWSNAENMDTSQSLIPHKISIQELKDIFPSKMKIGDKYFVHDGSIQYD